MREEPSQEEKDWYQGQIDNLYKWTNINTGKVYVKFCDKFEDGVKYKVYFSQIRRRWHLEVYDVKTKFQLAIFEIAPYWDAFLGIDFSGAHLGIDRVRIVLSPDSLQFVEYFYSPALIWSPDTFWSLYVDRIYTIWENSDSKRLPEEDFEDAHRSVREKL